MIGDVITELGAQTFIALARLTALRLHLMAATAILLLYVQTTARGSIQRTEHANLLNIPHDPDRVANTIPSPHAQGHAAPAQVPATHCGTRVVSFSTPVCGMYTFVGQRGHLSLVASRR